MAVYAGACARRDGRALCARESAGGLDFAVFLFVAFYAVADQDQHLAVGGATLVVGNYVEFIEHGVVYSDG